MSTDLEKIPFDHYQRYAAAASIVSALTMAVGTVLEVGANRQRLLADFLPDCSFVFSDLFEQPGVDNFVQADASALPFSDQQFEVAVALDVIEHMPVHLRAKAASEMARVASRVVIIACPPDKPWVHDAENNVNQVWKNYFGESYPWLDEHKEFGLVAGDEIEQALLNSGCQVVRFGQGDTAIWSGLMAAHFVKEVVSDMRPLVAAADRLYNRSVFAGDRSENYYREYFIGVRREADLDCVQRATVLNARADAEAAEFLSTLGEQLAPIANRILLAEKEWGRTAELFRDCEAQLTLAQSEHRTLTQRHDELTEKSNVEVLQIVRLGAEKSQIERLLFELAGRHELSLREIHHLSTRVWQLERRQRWSCIGAGILVLAAAAARHFYQL